MSKLTTNMIRDIAIDHLANTARQMGRSEAEIQAAVDECKRTNSDEPFRKLILPNLMRLMGNFNG